MTLNQNETLIRVRKEVVKQLSQLELDKNFISHNQAVVFLLEFHNKNQIRLNKALEIIHKLKEEVKQSKSI